MVGYIRGDRLCAVASPDGFIICVNIANSEPLSVTVARMKWDYAVESATLAEEPDVLSLRGNRGWELVSVEKAGADSRRLYFKRPR